MNGVKIIELVNKIIEISNKNKIKTENLDINKEELYKDLKTILILYSLFHYKFNKIKFHNTLMRVIKKLSKNYKLKGSTEFKVYYLDPEKNKKRKGSIDVVWWQKDKTLNKYKPVILFEIDSSFRKKSVFKLVYVKNKYDAFVYWIYYGSNDSIEKHKWLKKVIDENNIYLVNYKKLKF